MDQFTIAEDGAMRHEDKLNHTNLSTHSYQTIRLSDLIIDTEAKLARKSISTRQVHERVLEQ
jgi:hypothetical protein